ncbi:NUDIX hydrolase [Streptomyces alboflavus]|uniref:NUDIX hydrolase n=1 Tax=Streptomyces alboflavus TaxID=67267 RepID=UPI00068D51ED|nr:NUDIX hydrolase [Streptomyces alboflavus]
MAEIDDANGGDGGRGHVRRADSGGPVDSRVSPQPVDDVDRPATFTLMAPGWYPPEGLVSQAYGLCFTATGLVVLVATDDGFWNLPGGQIESGERPVEALVREVAEEACARVTEYGYLACQHVWDPQAPAGPTSHYQTRWWARVTLDPWRPRHETVFRRLVPPELVVDTLSWRRKEIVSCLLDQALAALARERGS